ncbi:hypothetical protein SKAU_G00293340 [Synaphobranchus kaupii]|uniref:Prostanoid TP receptor n=1 Tax=Synaphobranchus kaupii TaxID=118154 RepID=A0A9Q1EU77_SYNKA|nr:hypothetical protein SKAU_G00293340 [Synaphobranchus kaupii]
MLAVHHPNASGPAPLTPMSNQSQGVAAGNHTVASRSVYPPSNPTAAGLSMTLGILSNIVALVILAKAYARFRRRSKATFLIFASSLVATDFAGHVIPGALVLRLYMARAGSGGGAWIRDSAHTTGLHRRLLPVPRRLYGVLWPVSTLPGLCHGGGAMPGGDTAAAPRLAGHYCPRQGLALSHPAGGPLCGPAPLLQSGCLHLPVPPHLVLHPCPGPYRPMGRGLRPALLRARPGLAGSGSGLQHRERAHPGAGQAAPEELRTPPLGQVPRH